MLRPDRLLSRTAYFTAQAWAAEGFPNAELFDTPAGRLSFGAMRWVVSRLGRRAPSLAWHEQFLMIRHYAIDARLEELSPTFVLEGGAGLSPRGITFAHRKPEATVVEVDLPHIVHRKRRHLKGHGAPSNYHLVEGDLTDPHVLDGLPRLPTRVDKLVIITEGVLDYLSLDEKQRVLESLSRLLRTADDGCHLFDAYTRERLERYRMSARAVLGMMSLVSGRRFERQLFESGEAARAFALAAGYDDVAVLDVGRLNTSPYHPPMSHCHYELLEARAHATSLPSTT